MHKQKWAINCGTDQILSVQFTLYNKAGTIIYSEGSNTVKFISPGTLGEVLREAVCNNGADVKADEYH